MKFLGHIAILFAATTCSQAAEIFPAYLVGPVSGHLVATKPLEHHYTSGPRIEDYGKIEDGTLYFGPYVMTGFTSQKTDIWIEYRTRNESVDVRIFITKPYPGFYFITLRTKQGGYEQYQIQKK